jgi:hypothetical protein
MANVNDERCPYCFSKFEDHAFTDDPILLPNGSKFVYNEETKLLVPENDISKRRYKGCTIIKNKHIKELQNTYNENKPDTGWTPVQGDLEGYWIPNKQHIKELRDAIEEKLGITESTTPYQRQTYLEQYFNYDDEGIERQSPHQLEWNDVTLIDEIWKGQISHLHLEDLRHFLIYQTNMLGYGNAMGQWYNYCPPHCPYDYQNFYGTVTATIINNGLPLDYLTGMPAPGQNGKGGVSLINNFTGSVYSTVTHGEEPSWAQYGNIGTIAECQLTYPFIGTSAKFVPVQNQSIIIEGLSYTLARNPEYGHQYSTNPRQATMSFYFISYDNIYKTKSWNVYDSNGNPTGVSLPSIINLPNTFASLYGRPYQEGDRWYFFQIFVSANNGGFPAVSQPTWWSRATLNCASIRLVSN